MRTRHILGVVLVTMIALSTAPSVAKADDPPPDAPKPQAKPDTKNVRIIKPFSELKDLSAEQTEKLREIHKKYLDQIKAIEAQQHEELMAVLSDDQKKELVDIEAKDKIEKKVSKAKTKEGEKKPAEAKPPVEK
jgi:Spy/CpxP family protein refolding chaperone